ncbi:MAG: heme ABC exporter ATP-binding protein CcmA [Hyphomicrobiaceae bacterium]|nr:heme ABC exporter ATP-binding protein CcmA [Hyphomicrobiaceae bacterium]
MKLVAEGLGLARGARVLASGLSFAVEAGTALLVTGPNGAGKTTLLRAIAGLLPLAGGAVRLDGADPERSVADESHYFGHLNAVKSALTVEENARFWCRYLGGAGARIVPALEHFGLLPLRDIPAAYLSAGQKRRLGLCRLLLAERTVWLLDEPATSLDVASQGVLAGAVNAHLGGGGIVLAATHAPLGIAPARELALGGARAPA